MKIIKEGNLGLLKRTKRFECRECGCVFEADKGEYKESNCQWELEVTCVCPCCGNTVLEYKKITNANNLDNNKLEELYFL